MIKEDKVSNTKYRSISKSRNKMVKILAKFKSQNLLKSSFQSISTMKKSNFLTSNTKIVFTKLKQVFTQVPILESLNLKYCI